MSGKLSLDDRNAAFDFWTFLVEGFGEVSFESAKRWILVPTCGFPAADTNRVLGLETTADVTMVGQGVEALVPGQDSDANPSRLLRGDGTQLSEISRRPPRVCWLKIKSVLSSTKITCLTNLRCFCLSRRFVVFR